MPEGIDMDKKHEVIIFPAPPIPQPNRLGTEDCWLRKNLFANQTLQQLVREKPFSDEDESLFDRTMADALTLVERGAIPEALLAVSSLLRFSNIEARQELSIWNVLRELGACPGARAAKAVLGVILELPAPCGHHTTLAAWVDGSARYIGADGAFTLFDAKHPYILSLCNAFIDSAIPVAGLAERRDSESLLRGKTQVTLCTRIGLFALSPAPNNVLEAGRPLMGLMSSPHRRQGRRVACMEDIVAAASHASRVSASIVDAPAGEAEAADPGGKGAAITATCSSCGERKKSGGFSKRVWKLWRADGSYQPTCVECKNRIEESIVDAVVGMGFDQSLVTTLARSLRNGVDVEALREAVLRKYKEEEDCAICSFSFGDAVVMVIRPCCRQAICSKCNVACHGKGQPCAFCRGQPEAAERLRSARSEKGPSCWHRRRRARQ